MKVTIFLARHLLFGWIVDCGIRILFDYCGIVLAFAVLAVWSAVDVESIGSVLASLSSARFVLIRVDISIVYKRGRQRERAEYKMTSINVDNNGK